MSNFASAFTYLIANEGQTVVNDPVDRGGLTKFGITQKSWTDFKGHTSVSAVSELNGQALPDSVASIPITYAQLFYKLQYFLPIQSIKNDDVATVWLDASVLMGKPTAAKLMQQCFNARSQDAASGNLAVDGIVGDKTLSAINLADPKALIQSFSVACQKRFLGIVINDPTQRKFLRTWLRRACAYQELCV